MKCLLLIIIGFSIISCKKNENNTCKKNIIRDYSDTTLKSVFYYDTLNSNVETNYKYVYDIITINYCDSKISHNTFQSKIKYNLKLNQEISLNCKTFKIYKIKANELGKIVLDKNNKPIYLLDSIKTCELSFI